MSPKSPTALPSAFKRLAWSNLAAQFAEQMGLAATPLVAVLALGAGVAQTGLLQMAQTLPFLVLSLPAGLLADRTSRRRTMAAAEALRTMSLLTLLLITMAGMLTLSRLALLGFFGATGTVVYSVTAPSLVPALVPRAHLASANGRLELARSSAFVAGPAVAGALVGWAGAGAAYGVAAAMSTFAVVMLSGLHEPDRRGLPERRLFHDLRQGAGFVFANPMLRPMLLTSVFFNWRTSSCKRRMFRTRYVLSASPPRASASLSALPVAGCSSGLLSRPSSPSAYPWGRCSSSVR